MTLLICNLFQINNHFYNKINIVGLKRSDLIDDAAFTNLVFSFFYTLFMLLPIAQAYIGYKALAKRHFNIIVAHIVQIK